MTVAIIRVCIVVLCAVLLNPLQSNAQIEQRNYLTTTILEEKTSNPIQKEGKETIDLSNFIIDLGNSDDEFYHDFYTQINRTVSSAGKPVSINFSNSMFQGNFQLNRLGIVSSLGEGALSSLFSAAEQEKIAQYYPVSDRQLQQLPRVNIFRGNLYLNDAVFTGEVDGSNSLFLQSMIADGAKFQAPVQFNNSIFGARLDFSQGIFSHNVNLSQSHFFAPVKFKQAEFQGIIDLSQSQFEESVEFDKTAFQQLANFTRCIFMRSVNFSNTIHRDRLIFTKSKFLAALDFSNSTFEQLVTLRDIYANSLINFQDVHLLNRIDFSNAFFANSAKINASRLAFDAESAKIIGQPGTIAKLLRVDSLSGNETVLQNLIRNFRSLEQIADANLIEYQQEQLREQQLSDRLWQTSWQQILTWTWISLIPRWLGLNLLLLLGDYGTNISLIFSIGILTIAFFSLLFWLVDRYRPKISQPIVPTRYEIAVMSLSYFTLTIFGAINIFISTDRPWLTLITVATILIPLPAIVMGLIYQRGRYHQLLDTTYFVENGEYRQFRLLLGRLPVIPRFPFFRDRFLPILWDKRWNWLNYYDFSLNNIFKIGLNDIRLRDRHLPGLISLLVWYQWCLGVLYVVLLLWTLSRTIPGLNLLLYF